MVAGKCASVWSSISVFVHSGGDAAGMATVLFQVKKAVAGAAVAFEMELPAAGTVKDLIEALAMAWVDFWSWP